MGGLCHIYCPAYRSMSGLAYLNFLYSLRRIEMNVSRSRTLPTGLPYVKPALAPLPSNTLCRIVAVHKSRATVFISHKSAACMHALRRSTRYTTHLFLNPDFGGQFNNSSFLFQFLQFDQQVIYTVVTANFVAQCQL